MYLPLSLCILLLSVYVCNARPRVAVEEASNTQINISAMVSENAKKQTLQSNGATRTEDIQVKKNIGGVKEERSKHREKVHVEALESTEKQEISGLVPIKTVVSVAWRVPHRKQEQNPGFFTDYSKPWTRPPSHN